MPIRLAALALLLSAQLLPQQSATLPGAFWSGEQPQSPKLPSAGNVIEIALEKATASDDTPTVALFAACRYPGRLAEAYGARVAGATQIVAVNLKTGAVFAAAAERPNSPPLPTRAQHQPDATHGTLDSIEVWFNADLKAHLGLPSEAAEYGVFLWADGMTSTLQVAKVPGPAAAAKPATVVADSKRIRFHRTILSPEAVDHRLRIRTSGTGQAIYGTLDVNAIRGSKVMLTVLVLNAATREVSAHSFRLCRKKLENSAGRFDIDMSQWKSGAGSSVVAIASEMLSNPVSVP